MAIIEEMIISGFISKIISDVVDIPENLIKKAIKDADKKKRDRNQSIETRIYLVTIDAIKEFTQKDYKGQAVLYDAAESIIRGFKNSNNNIEAVRVGLKMLVSQVTSETCEDFLKTMCYAICMDENDILYKEIILIQGGQTFEAVREGFDVSNRNDEKTHEKLDYVIEGIDSINEKISGTEKCEIKHIEIPVENRAKEYADRWDKNVFLNNFNKRDENAGINIKLSEIYLEDQLPHYTWNMGVKRKHDLKDLLTEYIIDNIENKMLLILGQAGIGKSTLITWILANLGAKSEQILVYQFASDLKYIDWQGDNILKNIFEILNLKYDELKNKTLILDGFDEIYANNGREDILNKINQELIEINVLDKFTLIITCRENYVCELKELECDYITLQTWDEAQIKNFCKNYGEINRSFLSPNFLFSLLEKKEVFGVPLILYMVLALNINIEEKTSIVDVYDRIFSVDKSGIYDRCIKNARYGEKHRISEKKIKQQIHQISQRIAFWIFEHRSEDAFITKKEYEEICDIVISETLEENEDIKRDFLIGNYFKLINHCDGVGTQELHFIHRSIYEYFTVVYFFEAMNNLTSDIDIAAKLGELLKKGKLSEQILQFVKYKFATIKDDELAYTIRKVFQLMLRDGMTYNIGMPCKNAMVQEMTIFFNMLEVVHLWNPVLGKLDDNIVSYLQYNYMDILNLAGVDLAGKDLSRTKLMASNLIRANLIGANLNGTNLSKAYLCGAKLIGARLNGANLNGANLNGAFLSKAKLINASLIKADINGIDLRGADLSKTVFDEKQVALLHKKYDLVNSKVFILENEETVSYKEYCKKKH